MKIIDWIVDYSEEMMDSWTLVPIMILWSLLATIIALVCF